MSKWGRAGVGGGVGVFPLQTLEPGAEGVQGAWLHMLENQQTGSEVVLFETGLTTSVSCQRGASLPTVGKSSPSAPADTVPAERL